MPRTPRPATSVGAARLALTLSWDHEGRGRVRGRERLVRERRAPARRAAGIARAWSARPDARAQRDVRRRATSTPRSSSSTRRTRSQSASATATGRFSRSRERDARSSRPGRSTPASPSWTRHGLSDVRRSPTALDRARLLHHHQLLPGPRRLPPGRGVDRGGESLVRPPGRRRLPGRVPHPSRRGSPATRRLAGGGGAGDGGMRGAPRLRSRHHRRPATTRSARSVGGAATSREPRRPTPRRTSSAAMPSPG